jgi:multiple sugar transport system substrate-binding protein
VAGAVALGLVLAGCSGNSDASDNGNGNGNKGKVSITFWGWAPGYADAVSAFNSSHADVQVKYQAVQPGAKGGYQKMLNAVQAGNAPCLAQVGYETLPSFAAQGALQNIAQYANASKDEFQPASWKSVSLGDNVYGAPVDTGPMALFYNKKVFDRLGLRPPVTWDEYKADAVKIHASDPHKFISSSWTSGTTTCSPSRSGWSAGTPAMWRCRQRSSSSDRWCQSFLCSSPSSRCSDSGARA